MASPTAIRFLKQSLGFRKFSIENLLFTPRKVRKILIRYVRYPFSNVTLADTITVMKS